MKRYLQIKTIRDYDTIDFDNSVNNFLKKNNDLQELTLTVSHITEKYTENREHIVHIAVITWVVFAD